MLTETLEVLAVRAGGTYFDATFGAGGHARAIVERGARVIAFDRDPAVAVPLDLRSSVTLVHARFGDAASIFEASGGPLFDGALFDIGVSSMQLDRAERGFSFTSDGPLNMQMSAGDGPTAYDLLTRASENELAEWFFTYGEDRAARRIARAIVSARNAGRLPDSTAALGRLIAGVVHVRGKRERIHPATRVFQALRIVVNDELGELERGLDAVIPRVRPGGRIAAISFHSLEDRIVKRRFRSDERLQALVKTPIVAGSAERAANPRSRSAKLRVAERLG